MPRASTARQGIRAFKRRSLLALALTTLLVSSTHLTAQLISHPVLHNGYSRPYLIYRPAHLPQRPSVVFMLGGTGSTAESTSVEFGWMQQADRNNFLVVFPQPVQTDPSKPVDPRTNPTFWDLKGSHPHLLSKDMLPVDDDGYLSAVLRDVLRHQNPNRKEIFFAGFSSGSGMVQLFASRHPKHVDAVFAVATPLMAPPIRLSRPVPILYVHGDEDEQFSGFEINSPNFATTPHGNWVTWGHLNRCELQKAERAAWGVRFSWRGCKGAVLVTADFIVGLGHEWRGSSESHWNERRLKELQLNFTEMAWLFFTEVGSRRKLSSYLNPF